MEQHPDRACLLDELRQAGGSERDAANAEGFGALAAWIARRVQAGDMRDMPLPVWMALVFSPAMSLTRHWVSQPVPAVPSRVRAALEHAAWMAVAA